ncbi:sugar porter (SP) family MFS transporter [Cordyceps javanica]|uniref:Sugar porter (SP) family MFS transporter n=1 Tax=Cordyceps javanica TaxID=43265 RepID=A0A545WEL6_9HYPO|nr:sugar porter (SP) family MFS transporter [Cordyceps javanica]TQW12423.1 sugar porter (SP) family MFS transporter [Cordyceps javanica]
MSSPSEKENIGGEVMATVVSPVVDASRALEAAAATEAEHNLGLLKSLKLYKKACMWSIFFSTCIVMEGFDLTIINGLYVYPAFAEKFGEPSEDGYQLTAAWQSGLSNAALCGQILGLFVAGVIADRFGYRKTLVGALFLCICFIFIIFFAESLPQLLAGELLIGFPWGVFQTLTTTYAAEVCPTHLRAYLTTYVNLCWVMGQFIASGVLRGMIPLNNKWGYKIPFALQWAWPLPLMIGIWLAPESPWWLVRKNRLDDARRSLQRLTTRNSGIEFRPDETISMMIHTNEMERKIQQGTSYFDLFRGVNRRRTEIVTCVWVIQTLCGASFMGYSTMFYRQAGLATENAFSMSLAQYSLGFIGTLFSWFLMTRFGRRSLYLYGQCILFFLLVGIGGAAFAGRHNIPAQWAIGSLLLVYTFFYDCTVGPVCYSLVSEISSTRLRTKSVVFARNMYNIASIATNIITPRMLNPTAFDWGAKSGLFFAGTCALCITWTYFRLPEPKGRTFGELDVLFERRVSARKFSAAVVDPAEIYGLEPEDRDVFAEKTEAKAEFIERAK